MNRVFAAIVAATAGLGLGGVEEDSSASSGKPTRLSGFVPRTNDGWPHHRAGERARKLRFKLRGQKRAKTRRV